MFSGIIKHKKVLAILLAMVFTAGMLLSVRTAAYAAESSDAGRSSGQEDTQMRGIWLCYKEYAALGLSVFDDEEAYRENITGNQHCWAEFYLNGTGWVSADPADVLKAVLKGGWTKDQQETKDKAEYYWGGLDSQRVQLSAGRDITLSPAQNDEALNYFGYPYGEVDGSALDFYDPENFSYHISFTAE